MSLTPSHPFPHFFISGYFLPVTGACPCDCRTLRHDIASSDLALQPQTCQPPEKWLNKLPFTESCLVSYCYSSTKQNKTVNKMWRKGSGNRREKRRGRRHPGKDRQRKWRFADGDAHGLLRRPRSCWHRQSKSLLHSKKNCRLGSGVGQCPYPRPTPKVCPFSFY